MGHDHLEEVRLRIISALENIRLGYSGAEHDLRRALEELDLFQRKAALTEEPRP
jgi:hypothetical protein